MEESSSYLPVSVQWPEDRAFERLYHGNPVLQARLAMTLIGFREVAVRDSDVGEVRAFDGVLRALSERHPEFLQVELKTDRDVGGEPYRADPRLLSAMSEILDSRE